MLVYYFSEVLGPVDTYCWVMKKYDRYSFALYILKFTNIILNCIMTIRMLIKVYKVDKSIEEKRNEITFCIKTIVFPVIQIVLNITMTFFKLFTNHIYIGSFLSSFNGIAYPFYIIFYDSESAFRVDGSVHSKECSLDAFKIIYNLLMHGGQFFVYS